MVQASHARQVEFQYSHAHDQTQPVRKIKKVYKKTNSRKTTLLKIGLAAFVYAILVVYLCIKVSTMGYEIVRLEKDIDKLHTANYMLEFKIAEQISLDKVEMIATTQLGMCKPDTNKCITVAARKPEPVNLVNKTTASNVKSDNNTKIGEKTLHKLYSNLMLLAEKNNL